MQLFQCIFPIVSRRMESRKNCQTCAMLEAYYRLKVIEYAKASTAPRPPQKVRSIAGNENEDLSKARNITLRAGHALLRHWLICEERIRNSAA
jgi:hypothetical protein